MKFLLGLIIGVFLCLKVPIVRDVGQVAYDRAYSAIYGAQPTEYYNSGNEASDAGVNEYLGSR